MPLRELLWIVAIALIAYFVAKWLPVLWYWMEWLLCGN